jgi:hypothetical protein
LPELNTPIFAKHQPPIYIPDAFTVLMLVFIQVEAIKKAIKIIGA